MTTKCKSSNPIRVFRYIEHHQPCSIYGISKGLNLAYNTTWLIVRDLIFAKVINEANGLNENNAISKILTISKLKEEKNDN